jgi:hypothetical protein
MEAEVEPYIEFDIKKIMQLRETYLEQLEWVESELSDINWNSIKQVKEYFLLYFDIKLENVKIEHVLAHLESHDHDSPAFDALNGFVLYLKYKFTLKNYIYCIIKHEKEGRVYLRLFEGNWVLPNRRPPSLNPELIECVVKTYTQL